MLRWPSLVPAPVMGPFRSILPIARCALLACLLATTLSAAVMASPAAASSGQPGSFPGLGRGLETLCQLDCSALPPPRLSGSAVDRFDFELGVRVVEDDLDLTIRSGGDVYLLGPAAASESIRLRGESAARDGGHAGGLS